MSHDNRNGFTILELVVAISIIGLLMALILPAVQSAREANRQIECRSRLAQFGVAIHSFESTFQTFPAAQRATHKTPVLMSLHFYSPHVYLLPYFDQRSLAVAIDTNKPEFNIWNPESLNNIARTPIAVFECPSDSTGRGGNNYRFCLGTGPGALQSNLTPGGNGPFEALVNHSSQDIRDGLSNTVAVSEKVKAHGDQTHFEPEGGYWFSGITNALSVVPPLDQMVSICSSLNAPPAQHQPYAGMTWYLAAYDFTWYNHAVTPNSKVFDCSAQSFSPMAKPGDGVYKATSNHPGGVNCVFMDGRTKFISNSIDLSVWRALATRAGAELLSNSDY